MVLEVKPAPEHHAASQNLMQHALEPQPAVAIVPPPPYPMGDVVNLLPSPAIPHHQHQPMGQQQPILVMPVEQHTHIGSESSVMLTCEFCHANITTRVERVREANDAANGAFFGSIAFGVLIWMPIGILLLSSLGDKGKSLGGWGNAAAFTVVVGGLAMFCYLAVKYKGQCGENWRVYHYCPNLTCGRQLANVPANSAPRPGDFFATRQV